MQSKGLSRVFSNTTVQKHQFFCAQLSLFLLFLFIFLPVAAHGLSLFVAGGGYSLAVVSRLLIAVASHRGSRAQAQAQ